MSLYKRGDTYWFHFEHGGKHYQRSAQTGDKELAGKRERTFRVRIENAEFGIVELAKKNTNITLKELFAGLEGDYKIRGILSGRNKSNLKMAREAFKESTNALALTSAQIDSFIEKRIKEKYAPASTNRMTGMLRLAYKLAVKRGDVAQADVPHIRHLSEAGNERQGFFSETEFRALHEALPSDLADFALFGFLSSWRRNEIATLRWSDIEKDIIKLRAENAKDRRARILPIVGELAELIERRRSARVVKGMICGYVFHRAGKPILEFRKAWVAACEKAKVGKRLFHDLRRSAIVSMIDAGVGVTTAMSLSGHSTFSMFRRYAISTEGKQREAIEKREKYSAEERKKVVAIAQANN